MKRIASLALLALTAVVVGCTSPTDQLCIKNLECQDNNDPAAECEEQKKECDEDEDCAAGREKCQAESDAVSACILSAEAESECQGLGDIQFFLPTNEDACQDAFEAFQACQDAN